MREKLILNDVHLGVQRSSGTTPKTAFALGQYLLDSFEAILLRNREKDLIILGDLFDEFDVQESIQILAFVILANHLDESEGTLILVPGNHDVAKDNSRKSSFEFLCRVLKKMYPERVTVVNEPMEVELGHYIIPHMPNQELFTAALEAVTARDSKGFLYLHCNYDNGFAAQGDHSLNISAEQARAIADRGWHLIIAHEHQARKFRDITVLGNQWPSSIADCLKNPDNKKQAHVIDNSGKIFIIPTWKAEGSYVEVDWQQLANPDVAHMGINGQFIKVVGEVPRDQAAMALAAVSKLRQKSDAFVVASGLNYHGQGDVEDLKEAAEDLEDVNVLAYLMEQLDVDQAVAVRDLLKLVEGGDAT